MTSTLTPARARPGPPAGGLAATRTRRGIGLLACLGVLALVCLLSVALGARNLSPATVWDAFWRYTDTDDQAIVRDLRVPRTVLGLLAGVAFGLSGAVIQAVTRNRADPRCGSPLRTPPGRTRASPPRR
jgi:iron complex transport system permease protein